MHSNRPHRSLLKSNQTTIRSARSRAGQLLIEMLVAIGVSAMLITALCMTMMQTNTFATDAQGQVMAAAVAQEIVDACRAIPYLTLANAPYTGTHVLAIAADGTQPGEDVLFPRPLLQDTSMNYQTYDEGYYVNGANQMFQCQSVTVVVSSPTADNTVQISITVVWNDNNGGHTYNTGTMVTEYGINS